MGRIRLSPDLPAVVVGAGVGGLVAAALLAASGRAVVVLEQGTGPGGKLRANPIAGRQVDAGPTVFTLREVFDEIFAAAGGSLDRAVALAPSEILARHAWDDGATLDLFADRERSIDAVGRFAGADEARRFRAFGERARRIYETLDLAFMRSPRGGPLTLVRRTGWRRWPALARIAPFDTLWRALGDSLRDPRLVQLFGRYATYTGSSPFLAPATLMLIAHVEQAGVWRVGGGMHALADALAALARGAGATLRFGAVVDEIVVEGGRASGVRLAGGERIDASAVVVNADVAALANGRFGAHARRAVPRLPRSSRSLSALTWTMVARTDGFALAHHNVFFGNDYAAEFDDLFAHRRMPGDPTVYVCAQDRDDRCAAPEGEERLLCLANAPPTGDTHAFDAAEIERGAQRVFGRLARAGLRVERRDDATVVTTPRDFERLYPATGGALYGRATHGWQASFARGGATTRIADLFCAGGSVHPGPGVPMAALSGRLAAAAVMAAR